MIPKINRGGNTRGLMLYLLGPGRREEHAGPHLVAGSPEAILTAGGRELDAKGRDAVSLARFLDEPRETFGTRVTIANRAEDGTVVGSRDAHVWHTSLSLHPDEPALSDERWGELTDRFVAEMGFAGEAVSAQCRWVAVRHGESVGGSDHVHLVVGLVAEDGSKANVHLDHRRAQQAARVLEREFGLREVEARERGAGSRAFVQGEIAADRRRGLDVGERGEHAGQSSRQRLERVVRACAGASSSEGEFVGRLREHGVHVRPRYEKGGQKEVVGYSVRLPSPDPEHPAVWFGGGKLSRELTLSRLRENWTSSDQAASLDAWRPKSSQRDRGRQRTTVAPSPQLQQRCAQELAELRVQLRTVPTDETGTWGHTARETAAVFAAWSLRTEPEPGPLAEIARIVARSGQLRGDQAKQRRWRSLPPARRAASVLLAGDTEARAALTIFRQLAGLSASIADMHQAVGEAARAAQLETLARDQLVRVGALVQAGAVQAHASDPAPRPPALPDRRADRGR